MRIYYTCPQGPNTIEKEGDWKRSAVEGGQMKYTLCRGAKNMQRNLRKRNELTRPFLFSF